MFTFNFAKNPGQKSLGEREFLHTLTAICTLLFWSCSKYAGSLFSDQLTTMLSICQRFDQSVLVCNTEWLTTLTWQRPTQIGRNVVK